MANKYKLEERLHNEMIALGAELKRSGDQSFFWANARRSKTRGARTISGKRYLVEREVNFRRNRNRPFFNLAKLLTTLVFFTWRIRCTFPNPNWWAWCTHPCNRTTSHNLCCQKNMPQISFPLFPMLSKYLSTIFPSLFFRVLLHPMLKTHTQLRLSALLDTKI